MTFTEEVRREIISKPIKESCCKKAFLAGFLRGSAYITGSEKGLGIMFSLPDENYLSFIGALLNDVFGIELREVFYKSADGGRDKFTASISGEEGERVLYGLNILSPVEEGGEVGVNLKIFDKVAEKECCTSSFIKGLFASCGSITIPDGENKTGFHLSMNFSHSIPAGETNARLHKIGIKGKITKRKNAFVIYVKSAEEIKDFLAYIHTPVAVLKITELKINRELSNFSNRQKNCDIANLEKQVEACEKQIKAIEILDRKIGLSALKPDLKATAEARRENPDDTLFELAEKLNVSKSCLNHRLRKLVSMANGIKE